MLSSAVVTLSTVTSKRALKASMISSTSTSGADAPAVTPSREIPWKWSQSISAARWIKTAEGQPARSATSTRRSEFELLGEPTHSRGAQGRATRHAGTAPLARFQVSLGLVPRERLLGDDRKPVGVARNEGERIGHRLDQGH